MEKDRKVVIEPASDWSVYSQAWNMAMEHYYWYQENPAFDFNKNEELEEMRSDFENRENMFFFAYADTPVDVVGILGLRHNNLMARIRRWEPAALPAFRKTNVAKVLLEYAIDALASLGVKRVSSHSKYPVDSPELVANHLDLYSNAGFKKRLQDSVDLVMPLSSIPHSSVRTSEIQVETGDNYTFEDLASIVVKSFTSTPEERKIHGFDKTVTEHIQATALLQRMADGFYGESPDELRKVAVVDGVSAGYLGAFIVESKYKPLTGVLGPMAVLPDYRRRGIALHLIEMTLHTLKDYGCKFAAVGTPAANTSAIRLYEKAGFNLNCRLVNLEREL
ncbi:MAG: GNAT family N-acetyltransferase [Candidatus Thorarchaeota archaeon]|nr:GNAT family N-acetyltransferase [Candidatus Thorarchaeota archaeon]